MGVYHFLVFLGRRKEPDNIACSVFCVLTSLALLLRFAVPDSQAAGNPFLSTARDAADLLAGLSAVFVARTEFREKAFTLYFKAVLVQVIAVGVPLAALHAFTDNPWFGNIYLAAAGLNCAAFGVLLVNGILGNSGAYGRKQILMVTALLLSALFVSILIASAFLSHSVPGALVAFPPIGIAVLMAIGLTVHYNREHRELTELKETLERKVTERTKQVEEALEQKNMYFMNMAHETKTPLTLIANYIEKYAEGREQSGELLVIRQNIGRLKRDIVNCLDSDRLRKGEILYDHDAIAPVSEITANKVCLFREYAMARRITLDSVIEPECFSRIDPDALDRIINNLAENAIKYCGEGKSIRISLNAAGDRLELCVKDEGMGMSGDQMKKIFEPFYQASSKKRNIQGIGMGLSIVKTIIEGVGGEIRVKSRENEGTIFKVILGLHRLKPGDHVKRDYAADSSVPIREDRGIPEEIPADSGKKSILIVEDNSQLVRLLCDGFRPAFNVFFASNGRQALERLSAIPRPDLIISDVMMDEMDGYEFHDALAGRKDFDGVPFIFLTADTSRAMGLKKGAVDYIAKPFDLRQLKLKVSNILETLGKA